MRIDFKGRVIVVKQVQRALGLLPDGDDRTKTWQAIVDSLPLVPVPRIQKSFQDRDVITARVQRSLGGIFDDGHDGQETWAALAQRFDPALAHAPKPTPSPFVTVQKGNYEEDRVTSPNRSSATGNECKGLVIHHASGYYKGTINWCCTKGTNAGYHVLINTDGHRTTMGPDSARLYHSGESSHNGRKWCNGFMLGLAFIGNTNDGAMRGDAGRHLTDDEVASAKEWILPRMTKYGWKREDFTAHRLVSPGRKDDTSLDALRRVTHAVFGHV